MAVVDKLVLKDPSNTDVEYDIGASAQNVSYTDGSTPTTVKGKLDSINTDHINKKVLGPDLNYEGPHGLRGYFDSDDEKYKLQIKDGNNQKPIESGGLPETPLSIQNGGTGNTVGYIQTGQTDIYPAGRNATAEGSNTNAKGSNSHAEGVGSQAEGDCSHAEGYYASAMGNSSHAGGHYTSAVGADSFVHGKGTANNPLTAYGVGSFVVGDNSEEKISDYDSEIGGFCFGVSTEGGITNSVNGFAKVLGRNETLSLGTLAHFGIYMLYAFLADSGEFGASSTISKPEIYILLTGAGDTTTYIAPQVTPITTTTGDLSVDFSGFTLEIHNRIREFAQIRLIRIA